MGFYSQDADAKMFVNYHGYLRTCSRRCGWSVWWDDEPYYDDMITITLLHDIASPECAALRQAVEDAWVAEEDEDE